MNEMVTMNEMLEIHNERFELAKNRIKEFSEKEEKELTMPTVETQGGLFGLFSHTVTGSEYNELSKKIQKNLIEINSNNNKTVKEFREIYNTFEILDKDYLSRIITNVESLKKNQEDIRKVFNNMEKEHQKLENHQKAIEDNIANINKIIEMYRKLQLKLENCKHLEDVDTLWDDYNIIKDKIDEGTVEYNRCISLEKKIKTLYLLAGSALGIVIIEFIYMLSRGI